jgi:tetratricopeptide (TPR) repeat protein
MLKRIGQWLGRLIQWCLGGFRSKTTSAGVKRQLSPESHPLSNPEYEHFFMQLLDGVNQGWGTRQIGQFFAAFADRATEADWLAWLRGFKANLERSDSPNPQLALRLMRFGEVFSGDLAATSYELGQTLLRRESSSPDAAVEDSVSVCVEEGRKCLMQDDPQTALELFDRALNWDDTDDRAWVGRGDALTQFQRWDEALAAYDRALALKPDSAKAWGRKGDTLYESQQVENAIACWDKALALQPDDAHTWTNKGIALGIRLGRWEEAIACWDKALAIDPQDYETWFNSGIACSALEQWEAAIARWDKALEFQPSWREAWINKGIALQKMGRYTEAIEANNQAIALGPS